MATIVQPSATKPPTKGIPMTSTRKTALVAGIFYLITFISIPTLALYGPIKNHRDWILSSGGHTAVLVGGFLEVIVALAGIGTAVTLYPVVKRQNDGAALGFVAARLLEAAMIFTGVLSLLSLVTLRHDLGGAAGANAAALVTTGASHVAIYNWTMLLGQTLMPCVNALLLGSSRLASGWSSRASIPPPSPLEWRLLTARPPTTTSPSNPRKHGRAHQGPGRSRADAGLGWPASGGRVSHCHGARHGGQRDGSGGLVDSAGGGGRDVVHERRQLEQDRAGWAASRQGQGYPRAVRRDVQAHAVSAGDRHVCQGDGVVVADPRIRYSPADDEGPVAALGDERVEQHQVRVGRTPAVR